MTARGWPSALLLSPVGIIWGTAPKQCAYPFKIRIDRAFIKTQLAKFFFDLLTMRGFYDDVTEPDEVF